jgi:metallo-beta-lactamase family protein
LSVEEDGQRKTVVFSGDLGPTTMPILREYEPFRCADLVFLESTYGDHDHRSYEATVSELETIIREATEQRGKLLVPTFAVGRAQQIVYHLAVLFHQGKVAPFPVCLDSPMAIEASKIYREHPELVDEEAQEWRRQGVFPVDPTHFRTTRTADESKQLNDLQGPCLILAGSGMCNGGRILHHLKQNLWRAGTHVLIVGYQGHGTLGRLLVEGAPRVKIHGETIAVKAQVHTLGGFSAHAGQTELLAWFDSIAESKPRVALTHGEDGPREALARLIEQRHGLRPVLPALGETVEL